MRLLSLQVFSRVLVFIIISSLFIFAIEVLPAYASNSSNRAHMGAELRTNDRESLDRFGFSIDVDGDTAIVGAPYEDTSGDNAGSAYIFTHSSSSWVELVKLQGNDTDGKDYFGYSVAIDGDTVVVGARGKNGETGTAYIFTYDEVAGWVEQQRLQGSDIDGSDYFGQSVDIDGNMIVVGASGKKSNTGAAYVFTYSTSSWVELAKLQASDKQTGDSFGGSVAVDGNTVVVGAYREDTGGTDAGAAYVFTHSSSSWVELVKLQGNDTDRKDSFGYSVAIDGDTIVVGARDKAGKTGATYVFTYSTSSWVELAKLQASDKQTGDSFGGSVAVDGNTVVVGAYREDTGGTDAGAAYVFTHSSSSWVELVKLQGNDTDRKDSFGYSVAIDGDTIVVGARDKADKTGAAYVFTYNEVAGWEQ